MEKIKFVNFQFAFFFDESIRPDLFLSDLIKEKELGDVFDQTPVTIPIPDEPQFDITPIVQFNSQNNLHGLNISRKRADYFAYSSDRVNNFSFDEIKLNLIKNVLRILDFFKKNNVSINRIGFITNFFSEEEPINLNNALEKRFRAIYLGTPRSVNLDYIARHNFLINDFDVFINNRILIKKGDVEFFKNNNSEIKNGFLIVRDFNTVPEKNSFYKDKFSNLIVENYINKCIEIFNNQELEEYLYGDKK